MNCENAAHDIAEKLVADFCRLYERAGRDGRAEALWGIGSMEKAAEAVRKSALQKSGKPGFYLEFPFTGKPRMDMLLQYTCGDIEPPAVFCAGDLFGYQSFFDACARDDSLKEYICGFSFDLSEDRAEPGVYLLPTVSEANADYVPAMLERLGATDRIENVMEAFRSMPSGWIPYYAGLMAGRPKAPARLGFMVTADRVARYAEDIRLCERDMRKCYPVPFSANMRKLMSFLAQKSSGLDIQFDLYPDGSFGDGLGVTVNGASHDPRQSKGYMETGPIGEIMRHIEDLGLADGRWRLMDQTCYGIRRRVFENGRCRLVGDVVRLNAVKIRFRKGYAFLAKGYLIMKTGDLVTAEDSGGQTPEPSRLS